MTYQTQRRLDAAIYIAIGWTIGTRDVIGGIFMLTFLYLSFWAVDSAWAWWQRRVVG